MTCEELNGLLDRLMDGELDDEERRAMTAHAAECSECAAAIRATIQMKALFDEMEPEVDVPLPAQAKWRSAIRAEAARTQRRRRTRWIGSAAAAVVVLLGVGLAVNGGLSTRQSGAQMKAEVSQAAEEAEEALEADYSSAQEVDVIETDGESAAPMQADSAMEAAPLSTNAPAPAEAAPEAAPIEDSMMGMLLQGEAAESEAEPQMDMAAESEAEEQPQMDTAAEADYAWTNGAYAGESYAAAVPQRSPAVELVIHVADVKSACVIVAELAADFDATLDVQSVEGGSVNLYVALDAREAEGFLSSVAMLDASESKPELPELPAEGSVLALLVINPAE